jgi:hypothetical protein
MSRLEEAAIAAWHEQRASRESSRSIRLNYGPGVHDPIATRRALALLGDLTANIDPALKKRLKAKIMAAREAYQANAEANATSDGKAKA